MVGEGLVYHELLDRDFFSVLTRETGREGGVLRARRALEHLRLQYKTLERPSEELRFALLLVDKNKDSGRRMVDHDDRRTRELSSTHVPVYRLTITPLTMVCWGPELDKPNRVLREYRHLSDRFLRVHFTDENSDRLSVGRADAEYIGVLDAVKTKLGRGVWVAGRHYEFLAMSSSQLREHSCWFFASDGVTTSDSIREWMGDFDDIKVVAKYAARMGQCFSSTVTTGKLLVKPSEFDTVPDVECRHVFRFGDGRRHVVTYNFSDGIGMISPAVSLTSLGGAEVSFFVHISLDFYRFH